jgi:hypothetical protein
MRQTVKRAVWLSAAALGGLAAMPAATQQGFAPPIARYTMDAGTMSGMAAMAAGGGNPLAALRGGGGGAVHELDLRLGSSRTATGAPSADHFMPAGARLGASVPLLTPVSERAPTTVPGRPQEGQLPSGKLYLFWGCGEHAPAGQPVVIDFAKMARGQVPPGLFAATNTADDWQITRQNSKTFGEWPNTKSSGPVPSSGSLRGDHRVAGNYSPEIAFKLDRDFMPPLKPRSSSLASGAFGLTWNGLPEATGYYAWAMGARDAGRGQATEMVWWTSASTQQFGGTLGAWLSPAAVAKLVAAKTVMAPSQTSCTIPAEVRKLGGDNMMLNLYAYGPQSDFAYPPRPANAKAAWKPDWIARVRFRANAMTILGMPDLGGFGASDESDDEADQSARRQPQQQSGKPKCPGGLRGIAMRAAGTCS